MNILAISKSPLTASGINKTMKNNNWCSSPKTMVFRHPKADFRWLTIGASGTVQVSPSALIILDPDSKRPPVLEDEHNTELRRQRKEFESNSLAWDSKERPTRWIRRPIGVKSSDDGIPGVSLLFQHEECTNSLHPKICYDPFMIFWNMFKKTKTFTRNTTHTPTDTYTTNSQR